MSTDQCVEALPVISSLTEDQQSKFVDYVKRWNAIGLSTDPMDFQKAVDAIKMAYQTGGIEPPKFFLGPFNDPIEGWWAYETFRKMTGQSFASSEELNEKIKGLPRTTKSEMSKINLSAFIFGNQEYWLSFYEFFKNECRLTCCEALNGLTRLAKAGGWCLPLRGAVIFINRPEFLSFDNVGRLHNNTGPAIRFRGKDSLVVYAINGIRVRKQVVDRSYNVKDIFNEKNIEIRRIMISRYLGNFALDAGAEVIHQDDFGTLYRVNVPDDEPVMYVKVVNSTPEPDGSYRDYWIRVDPNAYGGIKTAQAAVASTWRYRNNHANLIFQKAEEYDPDIET